MAELRAAVASAASRLPLISLRVRGAERSGLMVSLVCPYIDCDAFQTKRVSRRKSTTRDRRGRRVGWPHHRHQALRSRRGGRFVFARAGEALAFGLRARRHQREREHERRRRLAGSSFGRDGLRRRFFGEPTARQRHGRRRARNRLHARSHGRSVQSHRRRLARFSQIRRNAFSSHRIRRRNHRPTTFVRARRASAPLRNDRRRGQQRHDHQRRKDGPQIRVLRFPFGRS